MLWPHEVVPIPSGAASAEAAYRSLSISVLKRCSDTSALYQMFKRLFDLYVFTDDGQVLRFEELNPGQIEPVLERASADPEIGEVATSAQWPAGKGRRPAGKRRPASTDAGHA